MKRPTLKEMNAAFEACTKGNDKPDLIVIHPPLGAKKNWWPKYRRKLLRDYGIEIK